MSPTTEQNLQALHHANDIRRERAELRARLAAGELPVQEVIADPPAAAHNWLLYDVLIARRGWGPRRVGRLLRFCGISETRPVGMLTDRQRKLLSESLGES